MGGVSERGISSTVRFSLLCGTEMPAKVLLTGWIIASWPKRNSQGLSTCTADTEGLETCGWDKIARMAWWGWCGKLTHKSEVTVLGVSTKYQIVVSHLELHKNYRLMPYEFVPYMCVTGIQTHTKKVIIRCCYESLGNCSNYCDGLEDFQMPCKDSTRSQKNLWCFKLLRLFLLVFSFVMKFQKQNTALSLDDQQLIYHLQNHEIFRQVWNWSAWMHFLWVLNEVQLELLDTPVCQPGLFLNQKKLFAAVP